MCWVTIVIKQNGCNWSFPQMWVVDTSCNWATQIACHSLLNEASPISEQANVYLCCCCFFLGWEYFCRSRVRECFRLQKKAWKWHTGAMMWQMCIRFSVFFLPLEQKIGTTTHVVSQVQATLKSHNEIFFYYYFFLTSNSFMNHV